MISENIKTLALELAKTLKETDEFKDMKEKEEILKEDSDAQAMLLEFQKNQEEFVKKRSRGEMDEKLAETIRGIQDNLEKNANIVNFIKSYGNFVTLLGEVGDVISEELMFDIGEVYRHV